MINAASGFFSSFKINYQASKSPGPTGSLMVVTQAVISSIVS